MPKFDSKSLGEDDELVFDPYLQGINCPRLKHYSKQFSFLKKGSQLSKKTPDLWR